VKELIEIAFGNGDSTTAAAPLRASQVNPPLLADAFANVEAKAANVKLVVMHPEDWANLRFLCRDLLTVEADADRLRQGIQASMWGATVVVKREATKGDMALVGVNEHGRKFRQEVHVRWTPKP